MAYKHDTVVPYSNNTGTKKEQVAQMFDNIAPKYDFINRFLSARIDISWRKKAIKELQNIPHNYMLDVASGTADLPLMMMNLLNPAPQKITGIDISEGMMEYGRKKINAKNLQHVIDLQNGDSEAINFNDNTFDAVTVSFGVRNFANLEKGLAEMLRVTKKDGKIVILEFSCPIIPGVKGLYNLYSNIVAPGAGKLIAGNAAAYSYLNKSIAAFPEGENFIAILQKLGYKNCTKKRLSLGICTIYTGRK